VSDIVIECPKCGEEIPLTESLAGPLLAEARKEFSRQLSKAEAMALDKARESLLREGKSKADTLSAELEVARASMQDMGAKLEAAQRVHADAVRKERELADRARELDLTVERRVSELSGAIRSRAAESAQEEFGLKLAEKEKVIEDMRVQVEAMKRKAEQGSQQLQGEVQELALEAELAKRFPMDSIEPVAKGVAGGDCVQAVMEGARKCGTILWESKRTKAWSDGWLPKLREDRRNARADLAVLVTQALPKGVRAFDAVDGVWVTGVETAPALALALRDGLVRAAEAAASNENAEAKSTLMYNYLTGPVFKNRIESIVEAFKTMQEDLEGERRAITRQWAKREEQIVRVMRGTVGMYGDMQGIAGKSLQEIEGMSMKALEAKP
jgi:hypothetical protein